MITKKKIKEFIDNLFKDYNQSIVSNDGFSVNVSVWYTMMSPTAIIDLIKILKIIEETPYIDSKWDVWRDVGYYDCTDDIRMHFIIDKDKIKKLL